jgi:extracellular elastinolytic metalloproteinase
MHRISPHLHRPTTGPLLLLALLAGSAGAVDLPGGGRHFDARIEHQKSLVPVAPSPVQQAAVDQLRARVPELLVTYDPVTGATRTLSNALGFLTDKSTQEPAELAADFLRTNLDLLGLTPADLDGFEVTDRVDSRLSGITHLYLRQVHLGLPVYNGQLQVHVGPGGRLLAVNNDFVPDLARAAAAPIPGLSAAEAVGRAAVHLGRPLERLPAILEAPQGPRQTTALDSKGLSLEPLVAELAWLPVGGGEARLVWSFQLATLDQQHWFDFTVDAETGQVWTRFDWTSDVAYRVYPQPIESPQHTTPLPPADARQLVVDPHLAAPNASPLGWHHDGTTSFPILRGNNAHAYEDRDGDNAPPPVGNQPHGPFDFPINFNANPSQSIPAALTNIFYWVNLVHDVQYQYGFNEVAGNFQANNFGRGGAGNDWVRTEIQDNALNGGNCNANFSAPPDGSLPRMQMSLCNHANPPRDCAFDNGLTVHEYGHGITTRQVGGPANSSCLNNTQSPAEGWSDWLALVYTAKDSDTGSQPRGVGSYCLGLPPDGTIRGQRYSTDPAVNNWTYASIAGMSVPHGVGSVWAQCLWEAYWALVDVHGFSPDPYNAQGDAGNQRALLYVNEGLKNTACSPTFLNARDGILQAAATLHGGQDVCLLWEAFAGCGLGTNASTPGPNSTTATNGFAVPASCNDLVVSTHCVTDTGNRQLLAPCPGGTRAVGGGCHSLPPATRLRSAYLTFPPFSTTEGFSCTFESNPGGLTACAMCAQDPNSAGLVRVDGFDPNLTDQVEAACPPGKRVLGGGCQLGPAFTASPPFLQSSHATPLLPGVQDRWTCQFDRPVRNLSAYAACADPAAVGHWQRVEQVFFGATSGSVSCPAGFLVVGGGCGDPGGTSALTTTIGLGSSTTAGNRVPPPTWFCAYTDPVATLITQALCK